MARRTFTLLASMLLFAQVAAGQTSGTQQVQTPPPTPPPAAQAQPQLPANGKPDVKAYEVGPEDRLSIVIYGETELQKEFLVGSDGMINYPFLGDVKVGGLSIREIEAEIRKRLMESKTFSNPQVVAIVTEYRSQTVQVTGAVNKAGDIMLVGTEMTLTRALARAELSPFAGAFIEIRRLKPGVDPSSIGPDDYDIQRVDRVDLDTLKQDPRLQDGDSVFVPKAPVFFLNGHVKTTGDRVWTPDMTVGKAIAAAGGLSDRGTFSRLKIFRLVDGKYKEFKADRNTLVQPEDQIHVAQRRM